MDVSQRRHMANEDKRVLDDLLDEYAEETRYTLYNGRHKRRHPDDLRLLIDIQVDHLIRKAHNVEYL